MQRKISYKLCSLGVWKCIAANCLGPLRILSIRNRPNHQYLLNIARCSVAEDNGTFYVSHVTAKTVTVVSKNSSASTRVRQPKKCVHWCRHRDTSKRRQLFHCTPGEIFILHSAMCNYQPLLSHTHSMLLRKQIRGFLWLSQGSTHTQVIP